MSSAPPSFSGAATFSIACIHAGPRNASRLHADRFRSWLSEESDIDENPTVVDAAPDVDCER